MGKLIFVEDPLFGIIAILGIGLQILTLYWASYLVYKIRKVYKYMKKRANDSDYYLDGNQQLVKNGYTDKHYKTNLIKDIYLLVLCISEGVAGVVTIASVFSKVEINIQRSSFILHHNGSIICRNNSVEKYMNYLYALEAPSYLVPIGLINSLIIYLTIRNAFFNDSYKKLIAHAARVLAEIIFLSTLALIPYTTVISHAFLALILIFETSCYIKSSRKLSKLMTGRTQDLQFENSQVYRKAMQHLQVYKRLTTINQICGVTFLLIVLLSCVQRILNSTLVDPCYFDSIYKININISAKSQAIALLIVNYLYYPVQILIVITLLLFVVPYIIYTLRHAQDILRTRNKKYIYTYKQNLQEQLIPKLKKRSEYGLF